MFEIKQSRARFGELQLEMLLRDIFPSNRLAFQHNIPGTGTPDACIIVENGKHLCIDSKFPLENFRKYANAVGDEKRKYWDAFTKDIKRHIEDIRRKYVGRENTVDFAFLFVPSDTIYYHLISEAPEVAVEASKAGVILASPTVLPAYLNLISTKIKAEEISERADEIQEKINGMIKYIEDLESRLNTATRHINNAYNSIGKARQSFERMKTYFKTISNLESKQN
jgi:DNA recombination protein RmuC